MPHLSAQRQPAACGCASATAGSHHHTHQHHAAATARRRGHHQRCHAAVPGQELVVPVITSLADVTAAATAVATDLPPGSGGGVVSSYTPGPVEVGWQLWFAAIVSTVPFVIGAYEFIKRIVIQRRCKVCGGNGLVQRGKYQRKCPECGGFFPWISWRMFLSANARPGNGGPLLQPRGQTSVFYTVPPADDGTGAAAGADGARDQHEDGGPQSSNSTADAARSARQPPPQ